MEFLFTVLSILSRVCIPLAINFDMRARNLAQRKKLTILSFFFPLIVGIVYAIKRKGMQKAFKVCSKCGTHADPYAPKCPKCGGYMLLEYKNPKEKMLKVISIILCVIGVASYCVNEVYAAPSYLEELRSKAELLVGLDEADVDDESDLLMLEDDELHYDRNGIAYTGWVNVKYFDRNGVEYHKEYSENDGVIVLDSENNAYEYNKCFIDEEGYLCYDVDTSEGKTYYSLDEIYWDYSGQLHLND